ncbi:MAG: TrmH family RNA methyltransferase [Chitinophagaceae bacterium]
MTPERHDKLLTVLQKRQPDLTVLLENVADPHNISAVMRTCDAVGIPEIYVLNTLADAHKRWGFRSSSSAWKWVKVHQFSDMGTCVEAVRQKHGRILTTHLGADSVGLYEIDFREPLALVFGNERKGVSEALRELADGNFVIPQMGVIQSLNISVACAVTLYEALRQKKIAGHYDQLKLPPETITAQMQHWSINWPSPEV